MPISDKFISEAPKLLDNIINTGNSIPKQSHWSNEEAIAYNFFVFLAKTKRISDAHTAEVKELKEEAINLRKELNQAKTDIDHLRRLIASFR